MISYHKASPVDISDIKNLLYVTWIKTYSDIYSKKAIDTITSIWHSPQLLKKQIQNPAVTFLVAKENKRIIAMCNAIYKEKGKILNIQRLHVSPEYQGKGIGSSLLTRVIHRNKDVLSVTLEVEKQNHNAIAFYKKNGFKITDEKSFIVKGVVMPCYIMRKPLTII